MRSPAPDSSRLYLRALYMFRGQQARDVTEPDELVVEKRVVTTPHPETTVETVFALRLHESGQPRRYAEGWVKSVTLAVPFPNDDEVVEWINGGGSQYQMLNLPGGASGAHSTLTEIALRAESIVQVLVPVMKTLPKRRPNFERYRRGPFESWVPYADVKAHSWSTVEPYAVLEQDCDQVLGWLESALVHGEPVLQALTSLFNMDIAPQDTHSDWIMICVCSETGVKEWVSRIDQRLGMIISEMPSPPPRHLWTTVLEALGSQRSSVAGYVIIGAEVRNKLVHRWKVEPPSMQMVAFYRLVVTIALLELQCRLSPNCPALAMHTERLLTTFKSVEPRMGKEFKEEIKAKYQ